MNQARKLGGEIFRWKGNGSKVECSVCLRSGFPNLRWQDACRVGHPHTCGGCERLFSNKAGLSAHRTRSGHQAVSSAV